MYSCEEVGEEAGVNHGGGWCKLFHCNVERQTQASNDRVARRTHSWCAPRWVIRPSLLHVTPTLILFVE